MPNKNPDPFELLNNPEILAENVTPEAAIEFWKQKAKLTWEEAKGLADGAKARAFYVTGLYKQDLVKMVSDALQEALQKGETLADFQKRVAAAIEDQGWKGYRVENIFRTNMQSAYASGRYMKMRAVKKARPYWQYYAIMDKRTRPNHAVLNGLVYPADHEFWNSNYPPNGFRCRCGVVTLSGRQVEAEVLEVQNEMPRPTFWTDPDTDKKHYVQFPGADKGFANNPYADWAKNGGVDGMPGLTGFDAAQAKMQPVTQKALQADIASLNEQIAQAKTESAKKELEAQKAAKQAELDKKAATAAKNKIYAANKKLKAKIEAFQVKTYSGIWKDDVATADWPQKAGAISAKKAYFKSKLNNPDLEAAKKEKYQKLLQDLEEFSTQGQAYFNLRQELKKNQQSLLSPSKDATVAGKPSGKAAGKQPKPKKLSTPAQRKAAFSTADSAEADKVLRPVCGDVWQKASKEERHAAYLYTTSEYSNYNNPLRKGEDISGCQRAREIQDLTRMIDRSTYKRDIWLRRGIGSPNGAASFLKLNLDDFRTYTDSQLWEHLKDLILEDNAFSSCGSTERTGFNGAISMRILCPKGTKMLYAEPFSMYGNGDKEAWDGKKGQTSFGGEHETILQRGTKFRTLKVERRGSTIYMEVQVVEQIEVKE